MPDMPLIQALKKANLFMERISRIFFALAGLLVVYMFIHIVVEDILRKFFHKSTFVLDEFVGYALIAVIFLAFPYIQHTGRHIKINTIEKLIRNKTAKKCLNTLQLLIVLFIMIILCKAVVTMAVANFQYGFTSVTMAEVPLWIPQIAIIAGSGLCAAQVAFDGLYLLFGNEDK